MGFKVTIGDVPAGVEAFNLFPDPFFQDTGVVYMVPYSAGEPNPTGAPGGYLIPNSSVSGETIYLFSSSRTVAGARPEDAIISPQAGDFVSAKVSVELYDPGTFNMSLGLVPLGSSGEWYVLATSTGNTATLVADSVPVPPGVVGRPSVLAISLGGPPLSGGVIDTGLLFSTSELPSPPQVFSGDTSDTSNVTYSWSGTPYRSRTIRVENAVGLGTQRAYEVFNFDVQEDATPLAAGDSSGQVGTISFNLGIPDPDIVPNHPINRFGEAHLIGERVRLEDSRKGFTLGRVSSVSRAGSQVISVSALARLGELNVYGVQAPPFIGTLEDAFQTYLGLANVQSGFFVDPSVATRSVVFPGWNGELWFNLKRMAAAVDCDISLVSGVILLRPIRAREVTRGRDLDRTSSAGGGSLAQFIEVYQYNNRAVSNELVYPPGGWTEEVSVINVNAGETVEEVIELSASVSSVSQPVMQTFVARDYAASSVYTVTGDDGLPITPEAWAATGGSLSVSINPDTTSLTVTVTAPQTLPNKDGAPIGVYSISLSSEESTGRYSTLRLVGSGVAFDKQLKRIPTGVGSRETATEVGVTIDNPFISTAADMYRTALRAVSEFNGTARRVSGSVSSVNRRGDSGSITLKTYAQIQTLHSGKTYAQVQTLWAGKTYLEIQNSLNSEQNSLFENQVFGNVSGARVWDRSTRRWYRIRSATLNADMITFEADDDLLHSDVAPALSGQTYAQVQTGFQDFAHRQVESIGVPQ